MFEHIFAAVEQDKCDGIPPGLDCGKSSIV